MPLGFHTLQFPCSFYVGRAGGKSDSGCPNFGIFCPDLKFPNFLRSNDAWPKRHYSTLCYKGNTLWGTLRHAASKQHRYSVWCLNLIAWRYPCHSDRYFIIYTEYLYRSICVSDRYPCCHAKEERIMFHFCPKSDLAGEHAIGLWSQSVRDPRISFSFDVIHTCRYQTWKLILRSQMDCRQKPCFPAKASLGQKWHIMDFSFARQHGPGLVSGLLLLWNIIRGQWCVRVLRRVFFDSGFFPGYCFAQIVIFAYILQRDGSKGPRMKRTTGHWTLMSYLTS